MIRGRLFKNNKFISLNLIVYVVIVAFCVAVSIYHIYDIRERVEDEMNQQFGEQLEVASKIMSDDVEETRGLIAQIARQLNTEQGEELSQRKVYDVLKRYDSLGEFAQLHYIDEQYYMYYAKGWKKDISDKMESGFGEQDEAGGVWLTSSFVAEKEDYMLLFAEAVMQGEKRNGIVIGVKSCKDILNAESFSNLGKIGDIVVTNEEGMILDCHFTNMTDQQEPYDSIYDYMEGFFGIGTDARRHYRAMLTDGSRSRGIMECRDAGGSRMFFSYEIPQAVSQLRIMVVYSEDIYAATQRNILISALVSCALIIGTMLLMVFWVYHVNKRNSKLMLKMAYEDEVTGGNNLNWFKENAMEILFKNPSVPFMIMRFDIFNFRFINEAYGHLKADQLLKIVYDEAAEMFDGKELCVRMNADQFVLMMRSSRDSEERFMVFTDRVNNRALEAGIRYPVKFKRGIYQIRNQEMDISLIIDRANVARKTIIGEEKELVAYYSDSLVSDMRRIDKIETDAERALYNDEFKMFIQPKWDITNDRLYGGEALVRWIKDTGEMVYPSDFVPVFEKNGFVEQLDIYMLETVCKCLREQLDKGREIFPISVNQSRVLMHNPNYISRVMEIINRYEIPKGYIELEVTETVFFTDHDKMLAIMNTLKEQEVMLSMDDFGSGYSSLNMLKDFPFDVLKIDKEFFSEATASKTSIWILRKIVEMAEGLGIRVICEGVETRDQVEMLKKIGCRYVQGYYYSKPIPAEEFIQKYCGQAS